MQLSERELRARASSFDGVIPRFVPIVWRASLKFLAIQATKPQQCSANGTASASWDAPATQEAHCALVDRTESDAGRDQGYFLTSSMGFLIGQH